MIDIWQFQSGDRVKAIDVDGRAFKGRVVAVWDMEELEEDEDCIDVQTSEEVIVGLRPSQISSIEKL